HPSPRAECASGALEVDHLKSGVRRCQRGSCRHCFSRERRSRLHHRPRPRCQRRLNKLPEKHGRLYLYPPSNGDGSPFAKGSFEDLKEAGIGLQEGLKLRFYDLDGDEILTTCSLKE